MSKQLAVIQKEINLYTSSQNVNFDIVQKVESAIKLAQRGVKLPDTGHFKIGMDAFFEDIDLDTFMYLVEKHDFEKRFEKWESRQIAFIFISNVKSSAVGFNIVLKSVKIEINIMNNDVKLEIKA